MDDSSAKSDAAASAQQPGFFRHWMGKLTPDSGSSDPRKLGKWGGIIAGAYLLIAAASDLALLSSISGDWSAYLVQQGVVVSPMRQYRRGCLRR